MDKKIVQAVLERSNGLCEVCGGNYLVQLHHLVGGNGKRKVHETVESVKALCWYCHYGTNGWHGKNSIPIKTTLRKQLQEEYKNQGYKENEIRRMMGGRLY